MTDSPSGSAEQAGDPRENIINFDAERCRRIMVEANRLADLAPGEWRIWIDRSAENLGIARATLEDLVTDIITTKEKQARAKAAEDRLIERVNAKKHTAAEKKKEQEAKAEKEADKEAERQKKEAARKAKEKKQSFNNLLKLPVDRHDDGLIKLAKRLGEDLEALRQEFRDFVGVADGFSMVSDGDVEVWPEPVNIAELLQNVDAKIGKYIVMQQHQRTGVTLWTAMAWVHNEIATHSPVLTATSADPGAGKTELLAVVVRLVPKPSMSVETTGPNVYRYVDAHKPTLIIDEADDLFARKSDLKHILNASWTRGTTIPRQVSINGIWTTVHFSPFCPKALGLLGRNLPRTLKTRGIEIRMQPKRDDEVVELFTHTDDFEFATLRRQLMRFAADHATALKTMQPTFPAGMNNRAAVNWKLMLAIAEQAGGPWPERAREAAERLTRTGRQPSDRVRLLAALRVMFADRGKPEITSEDATAELCRNPLDIWIAYNKGGKITQRQVAALLDAFDIHPVPLHPTKRKNFGRQGYRLSQFDDAFARYLPEDPIIQSPAAAPKRRATKRNKRKAARRR
jgi:hypothetical protein